IWMVAISSYLLVSYWLLRFPGESDAAVAPTVAFAFAGLTLLFTGVVVSLFNLSSGGGLNFIDLVSLKSAAASTVILL
ncbi:hypothetical protein ABTF16_24355, partial [Acinetobacter baumannii]